MKVRVVKVIPIGSYDFGVNLVDGLEYYHQKYGQCDLESQEIRIERKVNDTIKMATFWHEVFEAINETYKCNLPHDDVERLSQGTSQVCKALGIEFDWGK